MHCYLRCYLINRNPGQQSYQCYWVALRCPAMQPAMLPAMLPDYPKSWMLPAMLPAMLTDYRKSQPPSYQCGRAAIRCYQQATRDSNYLIVGYPGHQDIDASEEPCGANCNATRLPEILTYKLSRLQGSLRGYLCEATRLPENLTYKLS